MTAMNLNLDLDLLYDGTFFCYIRRGNFILTPTISRLFGKRIYVFGWS